MNIIERKKGFYVRMYNTDCFIETKQLKKTDRLVIEFLNKLQNATNSFYNISKVDIESTKYKMRPCTYTLLYSEKWQQKVYDFEGENFMYGGFESEYKRLPLIV